MRNTFASRALAHHWKSKVNEISRDELNKAIEAYKNNGGTIKKLSSLSDSFSRKLVAGEEYAKVYSWTFDSVRRHGICKVDSLTNEEHGEG
tara:strand:+ start:4091 stop:4363 length:273 start_codon:yes stop_codon:yes gene_type:complete